MGKGGQVMLPAPSSHCRNALLLGLFVLGTTLSLTGADEIEVEVIEVPASEAVAAAADTDGPRPLTLSERHARSQIGTRYLTRAVEPGFPAEQPLTLFECRELLAGDPVPAERTALVVELDSSRAYLLINGRMLLETPVFVSSAGREMPQGWLPVTRRVLDGAPALLESPHPTYWLELGDHGVALHAGLLAAASPPAPYSSVRLPRAAMASVFRHLQPGTLVYVCPSWLDSDADLPLRVSHQGFLPKGPMSANQKVLAAAPEPAAAPTSPPSPKIPDPAPVPSMPGDDGLRQRTLIPVSAAAAIPPSPEQLEPAASIPPPPAPSPEGAPSVTATAPGLSPRPHRLRDLWGAKAIAAAPSEPSKPKLKPVSGTAPAGKQDQNRKPVGSERTSAEPTRLRDLWTTSPDGPGVPER